MKSQRLFQLAMASALATSAIVIAPPAYAAFFPDVNPSTEEGKAIIQLAERGIISGYMDGTFKPANPITRTQAAKILAGILKLDTVHVKNPQFKDIKPGDENYGAIAALANAGIINGANGYFYPNQNITREQMSKMIAKGFGLTSPSNTQLPFTDVKKGTEFEPHIKALFANGITKGTSATTYGPKSPVKRSQLAAFVVRAEKMLSNATVYASQFKQDYIFASYGGLEPAEDIFTWTEEEDMTESIMITPIKEGTGKLVITGFTDDSEDFTTIFYLVHVKNVNGKLKVTLEEVKEEDYTENSPLDLAESNLPFVPTEVTVQNMNGQALASNLYSFNQDDQTLSISKNGQFIVTFSDGTQQQKMAADVYAYDFVRGIDLYHLTDELTLSTPVLPFEPASVALEVFDFEPAPVKATILNGQLHVTPKTEGIAILHLTGKNEETVYLYVESKKIAGQWAFLYEFDI
ncbi:S-layer homology domain-containing protein [Lysinibacillus sp. FSL M8-0355]|uniref:S-layer homology domain-containing protein n=1 Tax=Lysinibacillus sp. FSL M8-0355 TaxID=2921719 RepID=UPI0030F57B2F